MSPFPSLFFDRPRDPLLQFGVRNSTNSGRMANSLRKPKIMPVRSNGQSNPGAHHDAPFSTVGDDSRDLRKSKDLCWGLSIRSPDVRLTNSGTEGRGVLPSRETLENERTPIT